MTGNAVEAAKDDVRKAHAECVRINDLSFDAMRRLDDAAYAEACRQYVVASQAHTDALKRLWAMEPGLMARNWR